jgi:hypothetical protein
MLNSFQEFQQGLPPTLHDDLTAMGISREPSSDQTRKDSDEQDERVYQRDNGSIYIDPAEFVHSDEGRDLVDRFVESAES